MAATSTPASSRTELIASLQKDYAEFFFKPADSFSWDPASRTISYPSSNRADEEFMSGLLHEVGHARLQHLTYSSDVELIRNERDAWDEAVKIAPRYGVEITQSHCERCIDTYRDWLHARSLCPRCQQCGLQTSKTEYRCIFCDTPWSVSESRFCRVVRRSIQV